MRKPLPLICAAMLAAACHAGGRLGEPSPTRPPAGPAARVVVHVLDEEGSSFPGAVVTLARVDSGSRRYEVTDPRGLAAFHDPVPPGEYRILIEVPGYDRVAESIVLGAAGPAELREFGLKPKREFLLLGDAIAPRRP